MLILKGMVSLASKMAYKGFTASIIYDAENQEFQGKVNGTNIPVEFNGSSVEELQAGFQKRMEAYFERCRSLGQEPKKVYKGVFNVRITPELHEQAVMAAQKQGINLNRFVANAIEKAVEASEAEETTERL